MQAVEDLPRMRIEPLPAGSEAGILFPEEGPVDVVRARDISSSKDNGRVRNCAMPAAHSTQRMSLKRYLMCNLMSSCHSFFRGGMSV